MTNQTEIKITYNYSKTIEAVYFYACCILGPLGLISNILTIYIFTRPRLFKTNFGFLSALLSILNPICLLWNLFIYKYLPIKGFDISKMSPVGCSLLQYLSRLLQQIPLYLQLVIAFEIYVKIAYPFKFKLLRKKQNLVLIYGIMVIAVALFLSVNTIKYQTFSYTYSNVTVLVENSTNHTIIQMVQVSVSCIANNIVNIVAFFTSSFSRVIITTATMGCLDILTCLTLIKNKKKLNASKKKEFQFAVICLINDVLFFLFECPLSVTEILTVVYSNILLYPSSSFEVATIGLIHSFTNVLSFSYLVMPFFINIIFNKLFIALFYETISGKETLPSTYPSSKTTAKHTKNNTLS